ncbi:MAG: 50S ribosomal protein L4 [Proteobacteria bacterium]|nr:50S ribosomal protein L4 [Pseudomonadota bacterium]
MQVEVKDIQGKRVKTIELPDAIYDVELNEHVLHHVVKAYMANQRQGTHATKTRAYVSGGGKKPYKQKGTGGARAGSTRANNRPGGAVSHGPQPRDYRLKLNRKVKTLALRVALSDKLRNGKLIVVDKFPVSSYSTKTVLSALKALQAPRALLADVRDDDYLYRSARNIHGAEAVLAKDFNVVDLLRYETLIISEEALAAVNARVSEEA